MRLASRSLLVFVIGASLALVGCGSTGASDSPDASDAAGGDTLTGSWQWVSGETSVPASITNVPDPENYTITFNEDDTFNAKVDCNQVSGQYAAGDDGALTITPGPSTLAACPEGSADALFMAALAGTQSYAILGGQLVLTNAEGTITLDPAS